MARSGGTRPVDPSDALRPLDHFVFGNIYLRSECKIVDQFCFLRLLSMFFKDFTRPLNALDWSRFDYYARKIHQVGIGRAIRSDFRGERVSRNVLAALVEYRLVPSELLPNLRQLYIRSESLAFEDLQFLQRFLGPSLLAVDIFNDVAGVEDHICGLLWSMSRTSPHLREIFIYSENENTSPESVLALSGLLLSLSEIKTIEVEPMPLPARAVVNHLGTLSSLTSWEFLMFPPIPDLHSFTTQNGRFSNLSDFGFSTVDLVAAVDIVESMACPFEYLNIRIRRSRPRLMTETVQSLCRMTEVLSRHPSSTTLSHLTLKMMPDMASGGDSVHAALRPLFMLNGIHDLTLYLSTFNEVGDSWLDEASQSWPYLETLRVALPYRRFVPPDQEIRGPTMTLAGLLPLLKRCPNLGQLDISLIAKPFDISLLSGISCFNAVCQVSFPASVIESPSEVFDCIVLMFPHLRGFAGFNYRWHSVDDAAWRELRRLIRDIPGYVGSEWDSQ